MSPDNITGGSPFPEGRAPLRRPLNSLQVGGGSDTPRGCPPPRVSVYTGKAWRSHQRSLELDILSRTRPFT